MDDGNENNEELHGFPRLTWRLKGQERVEGELECLVKPINFDDQKSKE